MRCVDYFYSVGLLCVNHFDNTRYSLWHTRVTQQCCLFRYILFNYFETANLTENVYWQKACRINPQNFRSVQLSLLLRDTFTTAGMSSCKVLATVWIKTGMDIQIILQFRSLVSHFTTGVQRLLHILCVQTDIFWGAISNVSNVPKNSELKIPQ